MPLLLIFIVAKTTCSLNLPRMYEKEREVPHLRWVENICKLRHICATKVVWECAAICFFTRLKTVSSKPDCSACGCPFPHTVHRIALPAAFLSLLLQPVVSRGLYPQGCRSGVRAPRDAPLRSPALLPAYQIKPRGDSASNVGILYFFSKLCNAKYSVGTALWYQKEITSVPASDHVTHF